MANYLSAPSPPPLFPPPPPITPPGYQISPFQFTPSAVAATSIGKTCPNFCTGTQTVEAAAITTSPNISGWGLADFSLVIQNAPPKTKGVLARGADFQIHGVAVQLRQRNATNAIKVDGAMRFEIAECWMEQSHLCFWGARLWPSFVQLTARIVRGTSK